MSGGGGFFVILVIGAVATIVHRLINGVWPPEGKDGTCLICHGSGKSTKMGEFCCRYCGGRGHFR